ncbi:hypothetical protein D3C78_1735680 [compost metagenome]
MVPLITKLLSLMVTSVGSGSRPVVLTTLKRAVGLPLGLSSMLVNGVASCRFTA